jgi:hypothetical protein
LLVLLFLRSNVPPYLSSQLTPHACPPCAPTQIIAKNDKTKIFLPPIANPFVPPEVRSRVAWGPSPYRHDTAVSHVPPVFKTQAETARPKESTYHEHELDQVAQLVRSTLIGIAMVSFMHWKMGVKPVLVRTWAERDMMCGGHVHMTALRPRAH